jgi:hypothetical protein
MSRKLTEIINGVDLRPKKKESAPPPEPAPEIVPRLTTTPFTIDHRAEVIKEMRSDADVLDKQAAMLTHQALSLRISADHLEKNPP